MEKSCMDRIITELKQICATFADNIQYVQGGGCNISIKDGDIMIIKASGYTLSDMIKKGGYLQLKYKELANVYKVGHELSENEARILIKKLILSQDQNLKPSIETAFHSFLPKYVIHLHPIYLNVILCLKDCEQILNKLFTKQKHTIIDYKRPGHELSQEVAKKIDKNHQEVKIIFLKNHGLIVASNNINKCLETVLDVCQRAKMYVLEQTHTQPIAYFGLEPHKNGFLGSHYIKTKDYYYPDAVVYLHDITTGNHNFKIVNDRIFYALESDAAKKIDEILFANSQINKLSSKLGERVALCEAEAIKLIDMEEEKHRKQMVQSNSHNIKIVIPMSGIGQRFLDAGYKDPKPLIKVDGKPIIEHVVNMFPGETEFIFICNNKHLETTNMRAVLEKLAPNGQIVGIEPHKYGPVYALLKIEDYIDNDERVMISYCDFNVVWDYEDFKKKMIETDCDGSVPSYTGFHPHLLHDNLYAGVKVDQEGFMTDLMEKHSFEKNLMDGWHSAGLYYFKKGSELKKYFKELLYKDLSIRGEYYVSMAYPLLLKDNKKIYVYKLPYFMQWGTPADLEEYKKYSEMVKSDTTPNELRGNKKKNFNYWKSASLSSLPTTNLKNSLQTIKIEDLIRLSKIKLAGDFAKSQQTYVKPINNKSTVDRGTDIYKEEKQAFCEADTQVQKMIMESIGQAYPKQLNVVAEESSEEIEKVINKYFLYKNQISTNGYTLIIDPIDGTSNYLYSEEKGKKLKNKNFWAVSLCILKGAEPIVGVFYYPNYNLLLTSQKDVGTFLNGEKLELDKVPSFDATLPIRISGSIGDEGKELREKLNPVHTGSLAITFLMLLKSCNKKNDINELPDCYSYIGGNTLLVDIAVGTLAWQEAGGVVLDENGENINPFANVYANKAGEICTREKFIVVPSKKFGANILNLIPKQHTL
jgi:fructose-1,6-bisphosphatase/inositol monophosphatase family enzyme/NDP-sugar pyrophosphorylase family protein/ribulose-5-phosphate 4-epimerase/fuculose-1-phosphate aldolase